MFTQTLRPALSLLVVMTLLLGFAYPFAITGVAGMAFPSHAGGSLIRESDRVIGSRLIGQNFTSPKYFHGRPSATASSPYNGAASGGSNLGPLNPALIGQVNVRRQTLQDADPGNTHSVPVELVSASASGLDPHISPAAAAYQVGRVADARGMSAADVEALVRTHTEGRLLGFIGEVRVNVLALNLALDQSH